MIEPEEIATHVVAAIALGYAVRAASFGPSWVSLPPLPVPPDPPFPSLSIVVPARDEERSIEGCVRSLLAQRFLGDLEIIVVDDRSTDATLAILERLAGADARLHIVRGAPLPAGWVGKPWALEQGRRRARGTWLLFTDADSAHGDRSAATTLWYATRFGADALSLATAQDLGSFWERAMLPAILGTLLWFAGPLGAINDPKQPRKALANGQYLLVSRAAYDALGGHAALAGEIVEDVAFARRIKADGRFRFLLLGGERLVSVRMYRSFGEIWNGFVKNVYFGANGNVTALAAAALFFCAISALPVVLLARNVAARRPALAIESAAAIATLVSSASFGMRRAGFDPRLALLQPLGLLLFAGIVAASTLSVVSGRGVAWRGRRYGAADELARGEHPRATRRGMVSSMNDDRHVPDPQEADERRPAHDDDPRDEGLTEYDKTLADSFPASDPPAAP